MGRGTLAREKSAWSIPAVNSHTCLGTYGGNSEWPSQGKSPLFVLVVWVCRRTLFLSLESAQQALGGITRTVNDLSGGAIVDAQVPGVAYLTKRTPEENQRFAAGRIS